MDLIARIGENFTESVQTKLDAGELLAAPIAVLQHDTLQHNTNNVHPHDTARQTPQ
jgi:hypothetical protein